MIDLKSFLVKYKKYLVIAAIGLCAVMAVKWLSLRPIQDKELIAKMELAETYKWAKEFKKEADKKIKAYQYQIQNANYILDRKDEDLDRKDAEKKKVDDRLMALAAKYAVLESDAQMLETMTLMRDAWREKYLLEEGKVADLKDKVSLWSTKYSAAFQMGEQYRQLYNVEVSKTKALEEMNASLRKDVTKRKVAGTLKTGLIVAAGIYLASNALGGSK